MYIETGVTIRENPFTEGQEQQVVVSPQRMQRPWSGKNEVIHEATLPEYDDSCALCPGNTRQNGEINPHYEKTFIFPNDNPAFLQSISPEAFVQEEDELDSIFFQRKPTRGVCEVIVYSPFHNRTLMAMSIPEIEAVVDTWAERFAALKGLDFINHIAQFETRGSELGNSMPHPHGQIWASEHIPVRAKVEVRKQFELSERIGKSAMIAYIEAELARQERLVFVNDTFGLVVPPWAKWPYESMLIPTVPLGSIDQMSGEQRSDFAESIALITRMYATLFERPKYGAPYMMALQQAPVGGNEYRYFQMYIDFKTPLLTPTRRKFVAGYEENYCYQRDISPEQAADTLRHTISSINMS